MADALELWLKGDMDAVMQEYNKKPPKEKEEKPAAAPAIEEA